MPTSRSRRVPRPAEILGRLLSGIAVLPVLFSVSTAPAGAVPVRSESGWVGLTFAAGKFGAVLESSGPDTGVSCVLSLYTTVDGGSHWSRPIVFDRHAGCLEPNLTGHSMVVTSAGAWWVATTQGLYQGSIRNSRFELLPTSRLIPSAPRRPVCSVAVAGASIWATVASNCGADDAPVSVLRSVDGGATWSRDASFPLEALAGPALDYGEPLSLVTVNGTTAYALGWEQPVRDFKWPPLFVARTEDAGRTWRTAALPCLPEYRMAGFLAVSGREVSALCLSGPVGVGYEPMEVVTSYDGGIKWSERCNNGSTGLVTEVGSCPVGGYPTSLVATTRGLMEMGLGYVGAVDVSADVGRVWHQSGSMNQSSFVLVSGDGQETWTLPNGPVGAGAKMAESVDGRSWRAVALPVAR